jgi:hypothetical protein
MSLADEHGHYQGEAVCKPHVAIIVGRLGSKLDTTGGYPYFGFWILDLDFGLVDRDIRISTGEQPVARGQRLRRGY